MNAATYFLFAVALLMVALAYRQGGDVPATGWAGTLHAVRDFAPLFLAIFVVIGFSDAILPRDLIVRWLGRESGLRGIAIASALGAVTPGGPFVSYPLVAVLYRSGAGIGPLVAFVTAWSLWAVSRLPLELSIVGVRFTLIRVASTLIFPPLAGVIAMILFDRGAL